MEIIEVKKGLFEIKKSLFDLLEEYKRASNITEEYEEQLRHDIHELYNKYLKICVCLDKKAPDYNGGMWPYKNNCYYYALNLREPKMFQDIYTEIFYEGFYNRLGEIGGKPLPRRFTEKEILEGLYADLDALKIRSYESGLNKENNNGGYKIALYMRDKDVIGIPDFHFIRQNSDGTWSEKNGYNDGIHVVSDPHNLTSHSNYEYIQTLELVKPSIKELSL